MIDALDLLVDVSAQRVYPQEITVDRLRTELYEAIAEIWSEKPSIEAHQALNLLADAHWLPQVVGLLEALELA